MAFLVCEESGRRCGGPREEHVVHSPFCWRSGLGQKSAIGENKCGRTPRASMHGEGMHWMAPAGAE